VAVNNFEISAPLLASPMLMLPGAAVGWGAEAVLNVNPPAPPPLTIVAVEDPVTVNVAEETGLIIVPEAGRVGTGDAGMIVEAG